MAAKKAPKSTPSWSELKTKLADFDHAGLLGLVQDLYVARKDNKAFLHARFGLGELSVFYCEEVFDFLAGCGMDDEGFYDALVRMFEQALKYVLALPAGQKATFIARLDRVRQLGQNVGWGVGDDFDQFWSEAGLAGEE